MLGHIGAYSGKALTFQDDALNGLRGIISRWPFFSYYGIPFALDGPPFASETASRELLEVGFLRCLVWIKHESTEPSPGRAGALFPSWSWACSRCSVYFREPRYTLVDTMLPRAEPRNDPLLSALEEDPAGRGALPETSPYLELETTVIKLRFRSSNTNSRNFITTGVLCRCHQTASRGNGGTPETCGHGGREADWTRATFDEKQSMEIITQKKWDCALLFTGPSYRDPTYLQRTFLIIEWEGTIAYRVGYIQIQDDVVSQFDVAMRDAPQERMRITLG